MIAWLFEFIYFWDIYKGEKLWVAVFWTEIKILTGDSESLRFGKLELKFINSLHSLMKENNSIPFKVKTQIEDSALSLSSNIAEGYSRRTLKENLRFNEIALSSAAENYSLVYSLLVTDQKSDEIFRMYDNILYKFENKTISMNKSLIKKIKTGFDWKDEYGS